MISLLITSKKTTDKNIFYQLTSNQWASISLFSKFRLMSHWAGAGAPGAPRAAHQNTFRFVRLIRKDTKCQLIRKIRRRETNITQNELFSAHHRAAQWHNLSLFSSRRDPGVPADSEEGTILWRNTPRKGFVDICFWGFFDGEIAEKWEEMMMMWRGKRVILVEERVEKLVFGGI